MKEQFNELLLACLKTGTTTVTEFWNLTLEEIGLILQADQKRLKEKLTLIYNQSSLNAMFTALASRGKDLPSIEEIFPDLFTEREKAREMRIKELLTDFALAHNEKWRAERENKIDP